MTMRFTNLTVLLFLITLTPALSQKKVKLEHADELRGSKTAGENFQRLKGNVVFLQNKTTIYCDSAHFYKKRNYVEAFGHVRILEGDSVTITAHRLEYDGNQKKAKLRSNVVFTKLETATLYTDYLDFDRPKNEAYYFNGGKLVDSINVLTSKKGYYDVTSNLASFKREVNVKNPDYIMLSDSLQYNSHSKIIFFVTKTLVVNNDSSTFVYQEGQYDTKTRKSDLKEGLGESLDYTIMGNSYDLDAIRSIFKIRGDVIMTSKKENLIIYGQSSDYFKNKGISKVYNHAYMAKITDHNDTLFIAADTLVSIESKDPSKKRLLAYNHVRIFKNDLQGVADSVEYRAADSTIYLYNQPILWTEGNQMTADSIHMLIQKNTISKIFMVTNSFVISQDTLFNFNQIKGRRMTASFANNKIDRVVVEGNGESLYYALSEKNIGAMGMNKIICSNILIRFKDGRVNTLSFYVKPEANFIPPHELKEEDKTLKGFEWKGMEKPTRKDVISGKRKEANPQ